MFLYILQFHYQGYLLFLPQTNLPFSVILTNVYLFFHFCLKTMVDILSSLLNSLRSIFSFVAREAIYIWHLEENLDALKTESDRLIRIRDDLLNDIEIAEQQPMKRRTNQVIGWLERVQKMETKVGELQKAGSRELDNLCLGGFCSKNLISGYDIGKKVTKLTEKVTKLKVERGDITDVAETIPQGPAVELSVDPTIIGQESTFDEVWRCLTEQKAEIIGLYGLGGVGKTTLLKQINNNFRSQQQDFEVVIWVVVSKEPKIPQIQHDIGERICLSDESWERKEVKDKALDISNSLSRKKFVLLLDDLWEQIELSKLGIPLQNLNNGSKILFTTRSSGVCGQMNAKKEFEVKCLTEEEAWVLFEEKTGLAALKADAGILEQAKMVASECDGLPLALNTIGRTMASRRTLQEWKNALRDLRTTVSKFSGMEEKVYSRLKYSYDNLPSDIRSCFLYCCLFPEDFKILKEDLIHYWISEEFLEDFDDGYTVIGDLLRACLLEEEEDDYVKMHDVIRDMALWITCKIEKEEENFLVHSGAGLIKPPKIEEWKGAKRISLIDNEIESLSEIPTCPRLQTILLDKNYINIISDGFFEFMPSLRVLSLRRNSDLDQLPSGFSSLVLLQHLDLSHTEISRLPQELKALVNLRYLNLEDADELHEIPRQLLSSFSKLQVLRMLDCGRIWEYPPEDGVLSDDDEPLMKELLCLDYLNEFSVTLGRSRDLQIILTSQKLLSCTQSLHLDGLDSPLDVLSLADMKYLKCLHIDSCSWKEMKIDCREEVKNLLQSGFRSLRIFTIFGCARLKDLTWLVFAPNLKTISIINCNDLEEIIRAEKFLEVSEIVGKINLFAELEVLKMYSLLSLESIHLNPLPFPKLKEIGVIECPKLKKLPLNSSSAKERKLVIRGFYDWWNDLEWEDQDTKDAFSNCCQ